MIVKTKIINPTDTKQHYSWIPKHGMFIAANDSVVIEGDVYTLADRIVKNRKCIDTDQETGRVRIVLLTDVEVEKLESQSVKIETPKAEKTIPAPTQIIRKTIKKVVKVESKKDESNILGMGLVEGSIEDGKPEAFDPFTNKTFEDTRPEAEDVSNFLWGEDDEYESEETEIESEGDAPEEKYTEAILKKKLKSEVSDIAEAFGCVNLPSTKAEIIAWILDNQ